MHKLDGTWYIYYTAGRADGNFTNQRIHVLQGKLPSRRKHGGVLTDPGGATLLSSYTYAGQLTPDWGIDATVAEISGSKYLLWSCHEQDLQTDLQNNVQSICIAELTSPLTIGNVSAISRPTLSWENVDGKQGVNEGPAVLHRNDKTYLTFSASFCWTPNYQLGLLTLKNGADPLEASSWDKTGPVFSSANGNWGTGHNG